MPIPSHLPTPLIPSPPQHLPTHTPIPAHRTPPSTPSFQDLPDSVAHMQADPPPPHVTSSPYLSPLPDCIPDSQPLPQAEPMPKPVSPSPVPSSLPELSPYPAHTLPETLFLSDHL
ncbi:hypothetical protein Pmani_018434 [Petrolisthes manimaculis]|uniref:Uncharacterized protein n=1 Tax=Petrolisthes manimaculis TaxID=1843537 RepID=A0AAE1PMZ0_9EUCA|nr:hypothetical protein Pmani_018434 [Petrolisthes manimaculis]